MDITPEYVDLLTRAHAYTTACQDALRAEFRLADWPHYDLSDTAGTLVFADETGPKVRAEIRLVGTVSTERGTWRWGWANPAFDRRWTDMVREVRIVGESQGIARLTTGEWPGDAVDGWEVTSIAAYVLQAKGVYRAPEAGGFTYMVLTNVEWAG